MSFSFFFYLFPCITNSAAVLLTPDPSARADGGLSVAAGSMSRGQYCKERSNLRKILLMQKSIQKIFFFVIIYPHCSEWWNTNLKWSFYWRNVASLQQQIYGSYNLSHLQNYLENLDHSLVVHNVLICQLH